MKNWRTNLILIFIFVFGAAIIGRLVFLQIFQHDFYSAFAKGQQKFFVNYKGERGRIFFQNHEFPLAEDKVSYFVFVSPAEIKAEDKENTAQIISLQFGLDKDLVLQKIQKDSLYEFIKDKLNDDEVNYLREHPLAGVYLKKEKVRYYPYGGFASHIFGFVNNDGSGQYGIEEYWDDFLTGKEKVIEGEAGIFGYFINNGGEQAPDGSDLVLAIDYNIQYFSEKLLSQAKKDLNIDGGTIIVMKPQSGEILALADFPNFNPNNYFQEDDLRIFQTDAIQKVFEPGSVFKPFTMVAALEEKKVFPDTTYQDPGIIEVGGWPIYNYDKRIYSGDITMTEVLEKSINTGAVFAESRLGNEKFLEYVERFGIFEKTGIDLAGEVLASNREFKKGYEASFATASFGQGIEMTPMQLVRAFSAIANGGKLARPHLVKAIQGPKETIEIKPELSNNNIISEEAASKLTAMLVSVVENGFGKAAKIPGYYIAGKTGTAQVSFSALGMAKSGYSQETWQSFIGFAPAFKPKFLILVKLNDPETKTAEYSAVPIFKELAKYIIDYYQIPPDY